MENPSFDVIVIGCGMAGLAAGIRSAMYDKRVLILEKHNAPGGLNSFYFLGGRKCDVGLHAVTNYVGPGVKGTPLVKLLRQLRIPREAFELCPQFQSKIAFSDQELIFTNDFSRLESEIADKFPREIDGFRKLREAVLKFNPFDLEAEPVSSREWIKQYIKNPLLVDMLFCPLSYYGSARENDMDLDQFVIMWRALFEEGFARPFAGVRVIIKALLDRFRDLGGRRKMKCGVKRVLVENGKAVGVETESGEIYYAKKILSTIGWVETDRLSGSSKSDSQKDPRLGNLSFVETMSFLDKQPKDLGWNDTIIFFNDADRFNYEAPSEPVDPRSGVICFPNNYDYPEGLELEEGILRVTALANYQTWKNYSEEEYQDAKSEWFNQLTNQALKILPGDFDYKLLSSQTQFKDMFTPLTVEKFTSHLRGAIYGSKEKNRTGKTGIDNLFLAGTDQGFLGIIGAMLSGISMANAHLLR